MKKLKPIIEKFGDAALRLVWEVGIDSSTNRTILSWSNQLSTDFAKHIKDITISYNELVLHLTNPLKQNDIFDDLAKTELREEFKESETRITKIYIPVCYESEFSLDGQSLCNQKNITTTELIKLHTSVEYPVYFIGFLPGFPYLGGLDKKLHHARRSSPRKSISKGSVGIAGAQTGIYPSNSPGGWNIIGQSPMPMFNPSDNNPTLIKPGDHIVFYSILKNKMETLAADLPSYSMNELRHLSHKIYKDNL
jgi:inhibitor of KinA